MITLNQFGIKRQEQILSNGCRVILFKKEHSPISINALFFSGSRFDPEGKDGLAHFLEHMIVAGSKKYKTKDELAKYIEQYGGVFSAYTGGDTLSVNVDIGDPKDLGKAINVLSEIILKPIFNPQTVKNEKQSIYKEIGDRASNPSSKVWDLFRKLFFQGSAASRPVLGTETTLDAISPNDMNGFYKHMITSGRMVLVVSGEVDIEQLIRLAESKLNVPKSSQFYIQDPMPVIRKETIAIELFPGQKQVHFLFGFRTGSVLIDNDRGPLELIATLLGGGRAAVLVKKLRYEKGLVYNVSAFQMQQADAGTWVITTSTSTEKVQEVLDVISTVLKNVANSGFSQKEITFAKNKIIKSTFLKMQTADDWVEFHAYPELVGKKSWTIIDHISEINSVTNEDIKRVVKKYFIGNKWYLAMCGDIKKDDININL